ncbi:uncharacterized protein [Watersipora subatra]|uniref:uncharacterized protein n=1 Tax=Watersipora subatra TaxID=2589382 RepID=UPI00355BC9C5
MGCFESKPGKDYVDYGPQAVQRYGNSQTVQQTPVVSSVQTAGRGETSNNSGQRAGVRKSYPENDFELIITLSVEIEGILKKKYEATGKGLGELINSVQHRLDKDLVRRLRAINAVRNTLAHQGKPPPSTNKYKANYEAVIRRL